MPILTTAHLTAAVQLLKKLGVRFPHDYPPRNLDPGSAAFRGTIAEVETLLLLRRVIEPTLLELAEREVGRDTDVIVHTSPRYRLQIKGPISLTVRGHLQIPQIVRSVRREALREFRRDQCTPWKGVFSKIRIRLVGDALVPDGMSYSVDYPREVHVAVIEIDVAVLASMAARNMEGWIREAVRQLVGYSDDLLAPVINLARYPLDQAAAYKQVKSIFRRHPRWRDKVAGVILVLQGPGIEDELTGFHVRKARLVGVENPLAPKDRRLKPDLFNPAIQEEETFLESMIVISVEPPLEPSRIENGLVWVGDKVFGPLPRPLSEPFMSIAWDADELM